MLRARFLSRGRARPANRAKGRPSGQRYRSSTNCSTRQGQMHQLRVQPASMTSVRDGFSRSGRGTRVTGKTLKTVQRSRLPHHGLILRKPGFAPARLEAKRDAEAASLSCQKCSHQLRCEIINPSATSCRNRPVFHLKNRQFGQPACNPEVSKISDGIRLVL